MSSTYPASTPGLKLTMTVHNAGPLLWWWRFCHKKLSHLEVFYSAYISIIFLLNIKSLNKIHLRCPASAPSISPLFLTQDSRLNPTPISRTNSKWKRSKDWMWNFQEGRRGRLNLFHCFFPIISSGANSILSFYPIPHFLSPLFKRPGQRIEKKFKKLKALPST